MKNIHLVPTDKPSRLSILNSGKLNFGAEIMSSSNSKPQNIYITSDEEIKNRDCWVTNGEEVFKPSSLFYYSLEYANRYWKKIILTTDQDLIKDGVQVIDDDFLEWFVKNPSCEEVEVEESILLNTSRTYLGVEKYKIIIPKEESNPCAVIEFKKGATVDVPFHKKHIRFENLTSEQADYLIQVSEFYQLSTTRRSAVVPKEEPTISEEAKQRAKNYMSLKGVLDSQYVDFSNPNADKITSASTTTIKEEPKQIKCYCGHTTYCDCGPLEEPKQETLKEAKQRILDSNYITKNDADVFEMGVKWQQERSYSEEEVVDLLAGFSDFANTKEYVTFKAIQDWFEQFKKK